MATSSSYGPEWAQFIDDIIDEQDDLDHSRKRKRPRKQREDFKREDYENSPWQKMIDNEEYKNERTRQGLHFRRRYRVPAAVFDHIVQKSISELWFPEYGAGYKATDALLRPIPSLHVKILSALRILGRGCAFDDCYDGSFMDGQTTRSFFYRFTRAFSSSLYPEWVHGPRDEQEMQKTLNIYNRLGLTGAIGSTDCFHLFWDRCPQQIKVDCKNGKYKRCTLVFSIVNDHHRRIISCTHPFHGTCNDKVVASYDGFICSLKNSTNALYSQREFNLFDANGTHVPVQGVWLLCDGGYHKWRMMQSPPAHACSAAEILFREVLESARKSSECVIGILKARFWLMKHPIRMSSKDNVANMVWTCCILHNMLLKFDGLADLWTEDDWLSLPPDLCDSDAENEEIHELPDANAYRKTLKRFDPAKMGAYEHQMPDDLTGSATGPTEVEVGHARLRSQLVQNLEFLWNQKQVEHLNFPSRDQH